MSFGTVFDVVAVPASTISQFCVASARGNAAIAERHNAGADLGTVATSSMSRLKYVKNDTWERSTATAWAQLILKLKRCS